MKPTQIWYVYIIETCCGKLYTGITTDIPRRFKEHSVKYLSKKGKGAKFFLGHEPNSVVWKQEFSSRADASVREAEIKKMSSVQKHKLISK